jgi:serine/threonine protein kinase
VACLGRNPSIRKQSSKSFSWQSFLTLCVGAFGEVLFVKQTDGQFSAVKHSTNLENVYAARAALREIQVLRVLNHENIIHARYVFTILKPFSDKPASGCRLFWCLKTRCCSQPFALNSNAIGMTEDGLITSVALVLEPMDFSLHDAIYRLPGPFSFLFCCLNFCCD